MSGYWNSRKVVVTGGAGLLGSHLCDPAVAAAAFRGQEVVMHLASRAYGVGYSRDHHDEMLEFNRRLNSAVLRACVDTNARRVCVVSSSCVYPDDAPCPTPELPVMTGEPEQANRGYGWAKRYLEFEARKLSQMHGFELAIVRPFNAYSGRYKWEGSYSHVIPMLVKRVLDGENPLTIWGTGRQRRNFLHAVDFVRCFMAVTEHYAVGDPVNVGYEDTVAIPEIADIICRFADLKPEYRFDASKPEGRLIKSADSSKLRHVTGGIQPTISLEDGLREMVAWYKRTFTRTEGTR